ncbi:hypothetical protein H1P_3370003 [Hyella patelloides LEGE 07179]|uniref:Uncharacterized protein n=1 Tax=Hyella patelloides LEGE 07179 TaxID=945734 RepID=A0A563VVL9_9CYAN|nr:hypothetical protein H1P_3370003 [Hyella patelloides LEGE 07179]
MFVVGYIISSTIQVFVTRKQMSQKMGEAEKKTIAISTFYDLVYSLLPHLMGILRHIPSCC